MDTFILLYLATVNVLTFVLMGIDKRKAVKRAYRISERTFWLLSLLGGAVGCYIGMKTYRHKTRHQSFMIGIPLVIILHFMVAVYLYYSLS
ncbi:DUF1294 domain-containing protein [Virgibacillus sediminis]|uniref:DUF1294 domain-containing protein n=1 Tax=Virgibacillus sediminis TaxID=202260 RepID=A0ABV7A6P1_9BACI